MVNSVATALFVLFTIARRTDKNLTTHSTVMDDRKVLAMFLRMICLVLVLGTPVICRGQISYSFSDECDASYECARETWGDGCDALNCESDCGERCRLFDDLNACCSHPIWIQADYLGWFTKGNSTPPLVTTSP